MAAVLALGGCATNELSRAGDELSMADVHRLHRAPEQTMSALYRLRVPSSGGLRLALTATEDEVRIGVSEPFGSALSLTAWRLVGPDRRPRLDAFDFRHDCRLEAIDVEGILGVPGLPLPQVARLLAGRLPALESDEVSLNGGGSLLIRGDAWAGRVELAPDPWRVMAIEPLPAGSNPAWSIDVSDHTSTVPGMVRIDTQDGRWAEIELVRLEWGSVELPPLPETLPPCGQVSK